MAAVAAGLEWQYGLIQEAIARKRAEPGDDVISYLVRQEVDGKPVSDTAVMEMVTLLIADGVDTTTSLTGQAIRYLYEHPEQLAHIRAAASTSSARSAWTASPTGTPPSVSVSTVALGRTWPAWRSRR
jgi:cytochrome P450